MLVHIIEYILGLKLIDGGKTYEITPHTMGIRQINARVPMKDGWLLIQVSDGNVVSYKEA